MSQWPARCYGGRHQKVGLAHALVAALTPLSEGSPVAKDLEGLLISGERIDCTWGRLSGLIGAWALGWGSYKSETAPSALSGQPSGREKIRSTATPLYQRH